jgi:hypothetical protein
MQAAMTRQEFESEMRRAEKLRRLASGPTDGDYYAGYIHGLRRAYHGERFGTPQEHKRWLSLASDGNESRATKGRGYRDGLTFTKAV